MIFFYYRIRRIYLYRKYLLVKVSKWWIGINSIYIYKYIDYIINWILFNIDFLRYVVFVVGLLVNIWKLMVWFCEWFDLYFV